MNRIKTHETLAQCGGLKGAWDIEDLVQVGHKVHACPYFTARGLLSTADLIICPYNYLVDPSIRETVSHVFKQACVLPKAFYFTFVHLGEVLTHTLKFCMYIFFNCNSIHTRVEISKERGGSAGLTLIHCNKQ